MALPHPGLEIDKELTALVITGPQNDFLSPNGVTWGIVGGSVAWGCKQPSDLCAAALNPSCYPTAGRNQ